MATNEKKDTRQRNFATVVYPESAPENWKDYLAELKSPVFISPLHDKDINPDGELKKPHYHVMLMFEGKKSEEQISEIYTAIGAVGNEKVISMRGYARYLCHLDNPEKYQYDPEQVTSYGGADYHMTIGLAIDKYKAIGEMIDFCEDNDVHSYSDLLNWCRYNNMGWFRVLCDSGTFVIREYLKSKRWADKSMDSSERLEIGKDA